MLQATPNVVQDEPMRTKGRKPKHKGGYNRNSHQKHPGVSIVKRRGSFWIKWRTDFRKGVYRYEWDRLPDTVTSKDSARSYAKRKSDELATKRQQRRHRRPGTRHLLPVEEGLKAYVDHLERERRERGEKFIERAKKAAEHHLRPFTDYVAQSGIRRCEKLTIDDLLDFRNSMDRSGLKNASINRTLDAVRAAMNFMAGERYIAFNGAEIGKALKHYKTTRQKPRILDRKELKRLITALRDHDSARWQASRDDKAAYHEKRSSDTARARFKPLVPFVVMALLTGARPGELEALTADDVRLDFGNILIRATKTDNEREVPMHDSPLLRELATALKLRSGGGLLVGRTKRDRVERLGVAARIGVTTTTDTAGIEVEHSELNRQMFRRTAVAHVAAGSTEGEGLLSFRFGHSMLVSIKHYRNALHGIRDRGATVEAWLGVEAELRGLLVDLGYIQPRQAGTEAA